MSVTLEIGVPLLGMVRDAQGRELPRGKATNLTNVRRSEGELRTRPGLTAFADQVDTKPIQALFTAELADGSKTLLRIDEDKAYTFNGTVWAERMAGATVFTGSATQPFSLAMCNNEVILTQGVAADKIWRWTPTLADVTQVANSGVFTNISFKYLAFYAGRVIGAYTTNATHGAVHLIGSERGSNTAWVATNAAIDIILNDTPSHITGLSSSDAELIVWKQRHVEMGRETGDPTNPIAFFPIRADGIGSIGNRSVAGFGGSWFTLSPEGFYVLSGGVPQFIDADIRRDFWRRVNQDALAYIHALAIPEYAQIVWFVPEGSATYAKTAWVYDIATQGWDRWDFGNIGITAAARAFISDSNFKVVDEYNDPVADIVDTGTISGAIVDSLSSTSLTANYILGDQNGRTYLLEDFTTDDNGSQFQWAWETGDFRWEGAVDREAGVVIGPADLVTLDSIVLEYRHSGPAQQLQIQASADGGVSWTNLAAAGATTSTLNETSNNYTILRVFGRITGYRIRLRFSMSGVVGFPKIRNLRVVGQRAGEIR